MQMLAATYRVKGAARDVLRIEHVDCPDPGIGEVRVKLRFSGINPTDWRMRSGGAMAFPVQIPGQDGSGIIDAVGAGVDENRLGERVWVFHSALGSEYGTAAQWTCVPSNQAVHLPDNVSFEQGAGLGIPYLTAHRCLLDDGPVDGLRVLVTGGAGAVGNASIALGTWLGASVACTVSSDAKANLARVAGATDVIDYLAPEYRNALKAIGPVDRIVEVALGANLDASLDVLNDRGVVVAYATESADPVLPVRSLMTKNAVLKFVLVYGSTPSQISHAIVDITEFLQSGRGAFLPNVVYPLSQVVDAHEAVEGRVFGKVLLEIPQ